VIDIFVCTAVVTRKNLNYSSFATQRILSRLNTTSVSQPVRDTEQFTLLSGMWLLAIPLYILLGRYY